MFASRTHNENAIYEQQTAAAAKPLNQGVKGLQPKTPGNKAPKTPFKVPLNDENATLGAGKTGGKGNKTNLFGEGKSCKVDTNAFVTPAGPRNRAPLGAKTTNAKATAFKTPAPAGVPPQEKPSAQNSSPRLRRAKIKVLDAEPANNTAENEAEREIEYMPPRGVPLPDYPDDCWPIDRTYPQFEGSNLTRGWMSEFAEPRDEDGELSDLDEKLREFNARRKLQVTKKTAGVKQSPLVKAGRDPLSAKPAQGLSSRSAASALAGTMKPKAKVPVSSGVLAPKKGVVSTVAAGNARHTAAKVASNSTLGYSKGRAVSATALKPGIRKGKESDENAVPFSSGKGKTLEELFDLDSLMLEDAPANNEEDDGEKEDEVFQLDTIDV